MSDEILLVSPCYCAALRKAARRVSNTYDVHLRPSGLKTTQFSLLAELSRDRPDPPTMNELSEYLIMDRSTLGHNLRPLLRSGLVALLTTKGVAKFSATKKLWRKAQQEHEFAMGKEAAVALREALHKLATLDAS